KILKLGWGPDAFEFPITNVLHWLTKPRRIFYLLLPINLILGGLDVSANPYFAGILFGGSLGNMAEAAIRAGATDWIPIWTGVANLADFAIVIGMVGPWVLAMAQLPMALAGGFVVKAVLSRTINLIQTAARPKS